MVELEEESFQRGAIKGRIYWEYIRAGSGPFLLLFFTLLMIISQSLYHGSDIFLTYWFVGLFVAAQSFQLCSPPFVQDEPESAGGRVEGEQHSRHCNILGADRFHVRVHHRAVDHLLRDLHSCLGAIAQQNFQPSAESAACVLRLKPSWSHSESLFTRSRQHRRNHTLYCVRFQFGMHICALCFANHSQH